MPKNKINSVKFLYKYFSFVIITLPFLNACTSDSLQNDWKRKNLKGKIKSVIETNYKVSGNEENWTKGSKYNFGEQGYIYNSEGMLEQIHLFSGNHLKGKTINSFDETKHLKESKTLNAREVMVEKITGSFDKEKKVEIRNQYDFKGNLRGTVETQEDDKGNIIQIVAKNHKKEVNYIRIFKYNSENQILKQESYDDKAKKDLSHVIFYKKYDDKGNVTLLEYDDKKKKEVKIRTYQYKYDSKGNWTEKVEFEGGKARILIERELEYY